MNENGNTNMESFEETTEIDSQEVLETSEESSSVPEEETGSSSESSPETSSDISSGSSEESSESSSSEVIDWIDFFKPSSGESSSEENSIFG